MKLKTRPLSTDHLPIALYARLSKNLDGTRESVATQLSAGRRYCEQTWPGRPIIEFSDDNLSGADEDVERPGYNRMIAALRRGQIGDVAAKNQARITRQVGQWDQYRTTCLRAGIETLHTWTKGPVELAPGRSLPGSIMNLIDHDYVETVKLNVNDALDTRAREGRPSGGKPYAYAHIKDEAGRSHLVVVEGRDLVVQEAARRMLAGENLTDIVNDFNDREIRPARAAQWNITSLKGAVLSPSNAGHRVHRGQIVGKAEWEPVLDEFTWLALKAKYGAKRTKIVDGVERDVPKQNRKARKYMLSGGPMRCGRPGCGAVMYGKKGTSRGKGGFVLYSCVKNLGGCGKLAIVAAGVDEWVTNELFDYLDRPAFAKMLAASDVDAEEREALVAKKAGLEAHRVATALSVARQEITHRMAGAIETGIDGEIDELDRRLAALASPVGSLTRESIRYTFDEGLPDERRSVLMDLGCDIVVAPAFGPRSFNPFRLDIWFSGMGQRPSDAKRLMMRRKVATTEAGI